MPELDSHEERTLRSSALHWIEDPASAVSALVGIGYALVRIGDLLNDLRKLHEPVQLRVSEPPATINPDAMEPERHA